MNKSTPAPWFVGEAINGTPAIIGDGDSVVAYMPNEADGCTYKPDDARLLAAAHKLLKACELFAAYDGVEHDDFETMVTAYAEAIEATRAAIAAATGESHE